MTKVVTIQAQQKWDYCFEFRRTEASLLIMLNDLGQQGWELVEVLNYKDAKAITTWGAFLKRPNAGQAAPNGQSTVALAAKPTPNAPAENKSGPLQGFDLSGDEFEIHKESS